MGFRAPIPALRSVRDGDSFAHVFNTHVRKKTDLIINCFVNNEVVFIATVFFIGGCIFSHALEGLRISGTVPLSPLQRPQTCMECFPLALVSYILLHLLCILTYAKCGCNVSSGFWAVGQGWGVCIPNPSNPAVVFSGPDGGIGGRREGRFAGRLPTAGMTPRGLDSYLINHDLCVLSSFVLSSPPDFPPFFLPGIL